MGNRIRRLPDTELEVMQALWACGGPASRSEIEKKLPPDRAMAVTTLLTLLTRLASRGFVRAEKHGRSGVYTPLIARETYLAEQSRRFVQQECGGSLSAFAAALCDSGLSEAELRELRALLERDEL